MSGADVALSSPSASEGAQRVLVNLGSMTLGLVGTVVEVGVTVAAYQAGFGVGAVIILGAGYGAKCAIGSAKQRLQQPQDQQVIETATN